MENSGKGPPVGLETKRWKKKLRKKILESCLADDEVFEWVARRHPEVLEKIISKIKRQDVLLMSIQTQKRVTYGPDNEAVRFDAYAEGFDGVLYVVEIQQDASKAPIGRLETYMAVLTIEALGSGKSCYNMLPHELVFIYVRGLASLKPGVYTSSLGMEGFRGKGKLHIVVLGPDTDDPVLLQLWKDFTEVDPSKIEDDLIREVMTGLKKDGEEMAEMSEFIQKAFGAEIELVKAEKDAEAARALAAKDVENAKALAAKDAENAKALAAKDAENAKALAAKDAENAKALAAKDAENAKALVAKDAETAKALAAKDAEYNQMSIANARAMLDKGYPEADVMQFTGLDSAAIASLRA